MRVQLIRVRQLCPSTFDTRPMSRIAALSEALKADLKVSLTNLIFKRAKLIIVSVILIGHKGPSFPSLNLS